MLKIVIPSCYFVSFLSDIIVNDIIYLLLWWLVQTLTSQIKEKYSWEMFFFLVVATPTLKGKNRIKLETTSLDDPGTIEVGCTRLTSQWRCHCFCHSLTHLKGMWKFLQNCVLRFLFWRHPWNISKNGITFLSKLTNGSVYLCFSMFHFPTIAWQLLVW